jgi:tight adherence protein C
MLAVILMLTALTVALFALTLMQLRPGRGAVTSRLQQMQTGSDPNDTLARRRRQAKSERLKNVLQVLGQRVQGGRKDTSAVRQFLTRAGYPDASAVSVYWASRVILAAGLPAAGILLLPMLGASATQVMLGIFWFMALGWVGPTFYIRSRLKARQKEVQLALPDMLDMLVCCVEAGLGLNQALVRVSDEIDHVSPIMSEQLAMINLEMRAGTPRDEALKNFAERTGLVDIRSLVSMLVQTDRFGTSVATALRVHSETMRTKRRQRAEEAAAKTTIKLVFPLVLFVFPAMFVVVLGPSALAIFRTFSKL